MPNSVVASAPAGQPAPAQPPRKPHRWLRYLLRALLAIAVLVAIALTAFVIWARSAGSLATTLRLAGAHVPLQAEGVEGALLGSSSIQRLVWEKDGLRVEVDGAQLRWSPAELLRGRVHVETLAAHRVAVTVPPSSGSSPASGPPTIPGLPLTVVVDDAHVDTLAWAGPPAATLRDIRLAARADRKGYTLNLHNLDLEQAPYQARIQAQAQVRSGSAPRIAATVAAAAAAPLQTDGPSLPVTAQAQVSGPLTDLLAAVSVQLVSQPSSATGGRMLPDLPTLAPLPALAAASGSMEGAALTAPAHGLSARARITPWQALPVARADVALQDFNLAALMPALPRTELSGTAQLATAPSDPAPAWNLKTDIRNGAAGAWDAHQLPLDALAADVTFAPSGSAQIHTLQAQVAGGTITAKGDWHAPQPPSPDADANLAAENWQTTVTLQGIQPQRIQSTLAGPALAGRAQAQGDSAGAIAFDVALQTQSSAPNKAPKAAGKPALDLNSLGLKSAAAEGRWDHGHLLLKRLELDTREARVEGHADLDLSDLAQAGGSAAMQVQAPGLHLAVDGALQPDQGKGTVNLKLSDASRLLTWARTLPGASAALEGVHLAGNATLNGGWQGGWRNPDVHLQLDAPKFQPTAGVELRAVATRLSGTLARLQLTSRGEAQLDKQQIAWDLAADGGRTTPQSPLAESDWKARLASLQVRATSPDLGGTWRADLAAPLALAWSARHALDVAAGELALRPPAAVAGRDTQAATLAWGKTHWQGGTLTTTGQLRHLPMQWVDRISGQALSHAGIQGDLVFDGNWDIALGKTPRATIRLARTRGDLNVIASDSATHTQARVAAGVQDASAQVQLNGSQLRATLSWKSQQAGNIDGQVQTQLSAVRDRAGNTRWTWSEKAPLSGQIHASLPSIATWSVLAPPGWRLRGALNADVQVGGTRAAPALSGTLGADDLALRSVVDGLFFKRGKLRAHFQGTQLFIDEFVLHGAGRGDSAGTVRATGSAGLINGRTQAQLAITLDALHALAARDRQVTLSGKVDAGYDGHTVRADGAITVDHALIVLPDGSRPSLGSDVVVSGPDGKLLGAAPKAPPPAPTPGQKEDSSGMDARVDVKIDLGKDFQLQGQGIETRLAGALTIRADGPITAMPQVSGKIETVGGSFRAYGQELNIDHGAIYFSGNATNPSLNVIALRPNYLSDQKVGVQVQGTAMLPQVKLYSDPALGDSQTLTWLLLGHASPENGDEAALVQTAALAVLSGRSGKSLASTFGLDQLGFSPGGGAGDKEASVTLGKRISDKLYAAYEQSLGGAGGVLMIFYELSRRWLVRGQAGQASAVDLIYKLSYE